MLALIFELKPEQILELMLDLTKPNHKEGAIMRRLKYEEDISSLAQGLGH